MTNTDIKISLEAARVNAKMTQAEAAQRLGINRTTLIRWEKGESVMNASQLMRIADLYQMPVQYLFLPTKTT